ncbi:MAG: MATE family efflux transporter [Planctomycetaceae bacterium]|nr:MATE family efflux transporter [Planctomycetaceae bacterium]
MPKNCLWNWWSRPAGYREVLRIAIPMIISAGSWAIMTFSDRVMLTWYSENAAAFPADAAATAGSTIGSATAAAAAAGSLVFVVASLPFGIVMLVTAFVAQYYGAGKHHRIGPIVWQGIFFSMAVAPLYLFAKPLFMAVFHGMEHDPALIVQEERYLHYALFGVGAMVGGEAVAAFFIGRGKTQTVMVVNVTTVSLNILLNYLMIFGKWGLPEMGVGGAALATTLCTWLRFFTFFTLIFVASGKRDPFGFVSGCRPDFLLMRRLMRFGLPSGLEFFLENAGFGAFILLMGTISAQAMAATSIAFSLNGLSFLPLIGMGIAVMSMVGRYLGENKPELAQRATLTALTLGTATNAVFVILYLFFPDQLLYAFLKFGDPVEFAPLRDMTVMILRFVAIYLLFDGINIIFMSAIKGAGDTMFLLLLTLIMSPMLPIACALALANGFGLFACWLILTIWICVFAACFCVRFWQGQWKTKRVIEPDALR